MKRILVDEGYGEYSIEGKSPLRRFYNDCDCKGFADSRENHILRTKGDICPYCKKQFTIVEDELTVAMDTSYDGDGNKHYGDLIPLSGLINLIDEIKGEKA